jgi:hypothetical protein
MLGWLRRVFATPSPQDSKEPSQVAVVTPAEKRELADAKTHVRQIDRRIDALLSDYRLQDKELILRRR